MRHAIDIRNLGLIGGIEVDARSGAPMPRALEVHRTRCDAGVLVRATEDIIVLSPPLIIEKTQIDQIAGTIRRALTTLV